MDHPELPQSLESLLKPVGATSAFAEVGAKLNSASQAKASIYLCPMCKTKRVLKTSLSPYTALNFIRVGVTSALITVALWPLCSWRGAVVAFPLWVGFEIIHRSRVRFSLNCDKCGFDPVLYLKDVSRAKQVVHEHLSAQLGHMEAQRAAQETQKNTASNQSKRVDNDPLTEAKPER